MKQSKFILIVVVSLILAILLFSIPHRNVPKLSYKNIKIERIKQQIQNSKTIQQNVVETSKEEEKSDLGLLVKFNFNTKIYPVNKLSKVNIVSDTMGGAMINIIYIQDENKFKITNAITGETIPYTEGKTEELVENNPRATIYTGE